MRRLLSTGLNNSGIYAENENKMLSYEYPTMFITRTESVFYARRQRIRRVPSPASREFSCLSGLPSSIVRFMETDENYL